MNAFALRFDPAFLLCDLVCAALCGLRGSAALAYRAVSAVRSARRRA